MLPNSFDNRSMNPIYLVLFLLVWWRGEGFLRAVKAGKGTPYIYIKCIGRCGIGDPILGVRLSCGVRRADAEDVGDGLGYVRSFDDRVVEVTCRDACSEEDAGAADGCGVKP